LEFTRAGAVHFHIALSHSVSDESRIEWARYWAKKTSKRIGPYCSLRTKRRLDPEIAIFEVNAHPKTWENIRNEDGAKRYIAKYAGKPYQKTVPDWFSDIGRFWGVSSDVRASIPHPEITPIDEDEVRELLIESRHKVAEWDILPRYIWNFPEKRGSK
jgi:hypothetical protein